MTSIYFGRTDLLGHRYWDAYEPEPYGHARDSRRVKVFGSILTSYYAFIDEAIGRLLANMPADTTVLIASDHGMGTPPQVLWKDQTRGSVTQRPHAR